MWDSTSSARFLCRCSCCKINSFLKGQSMPCRRKEELCHLRTSQGWLQLVTDLENRPLPSEDTDEDADEGALPERLICDDPTWMLAFLEGLQDCDVTCGIPRNLQHAGPLYCAWDASQNVLLDNQKSLHGWLRLSDLCRNESSNPSAPRTMPFITRTSHGEVWKQTVHVTKGAFVRGQGCFHVNPTCKGLRISQTKVLDTTYDSIFRMQPMSVFRSCKLCSGVLANPS